MKKIKQLLLMVTILIGASFDAVCQPYQKGTFSLSAGGEVLFPDRDLSKSNKTGLGATLKGEYVFSKHSTVTLLSGYYFMNGNNSLLVDYEDISAVPIKAGIRYYLGSFYGAGEAGAIFSFGSSPETDFVYSFGLGDKIKIKSRVIDITLRHETWVFMGNTSAVIGLRLGYEFAVNKKPTRRSDF
jgi:hypothetical protein